MAVSLTRAASIAPSLSVIVPTLGLSRWLVPCLRALRQDGGAEMEIVLVSQQGFQDPEAEELADEVLRPEVNLGFAGANNLGFTVARGDWLATVNDDAVVEAGWSRRLLEAVESRPEVAAVQGLNLDLEDPSTVDGGGLAWNRSWQAVQIGHGDSADGMPSGPTEIFGVSATAAIYRRSALEKIAGSELAVFDRRLFAYYEDVDLACRLRGAGFLALLVPTARVRHAGSLSGSLIRGGNRRLIYRNRHLVLARLLGRAFWLRWPRILLRDAADFAGAVRRRDISGATGIARGLMSALRHGPSFVRGGSPMVPVVTLRRFANPPCPERAVSADV